MCDCGALDCRACRGSDTRPDYDGDDTTADLIAEIRGLMDDAELMHELGQDAKARASLREICIRLQDTMEA